MSATLTTAISQKSAISLLTNGTSLARLDQPQSRGTEFSIDLNAETKDAIIELKIINDLCKQFKIFSVLQKKTFLSEFLKICSYESLKEFKLFLEPLLHRDFCINADSDYPAWIKLNDRYRIIFSQNDNKKLIKNTPYTIPSFYIPLRSPSQDKLNKSAVSSLQQSAVGIQRKLPSRAQSKNTRASSNIKNFRIPSQNSLRTPQYGSIRTPGESRRTQKNQPSGTFKALFSNTMNTRKLISQGTLKRPGFSRDQSKASLKRENSNSQIKRSAVPIGRAQNFKPHGEIHKSETKSNKSIENFIAEKQKSLAKKSWNLNEEIFWIKRKTNTNSLIDKIKLLFRNKYDTREMRISRMVSKNTENNEIKKSAKAKKSSADQGVSIYVNKLKNNYYDRKLWKSLDLLENRNALNLFIDTERVYTTDFTILERNDWTQSKFGKSLSKFKQLPSSTQSVNITNTVASNIDFNYPSSGNSDKKISNHFERDDYLRVCDINFKIIQNWSHTRRVTLLSALLKYCNNDILLHFREEIKNRLDGNDVSVNSLPDNILIFIFSKLDIDSLENVASVCQRWNYLANTSELWIYKCRLMGQKEKLFEIDNIIFKELREDEDIDWKLAYFELQEFARRIKSDYSQAISDLDKPKESKSRRESVLSLKCDQSRKASPVGSEKSLSRRNSLINEDFKRTSIISMRSRANSYVNFYVENKPKKIKINRKSSLTEHNLKVLSRINRDRSRASSISSQSSRGSQKANVKFHESQLKNEFSFTSSETSDDEINHPKRSNQKIKLKPFSINISEDIHEIKTDLIQSRDLLGKIVPTFKLRWRTEGEGIEDLKSSEKLHFNIKKIIQVRELQCHNEGVTCMDTDKRRLITGSMDRSICVFDVRNGTFIRRLNGHKGGIRCVQLFSNRLCSGSWDSTLKIWNLITYKLVHTIYDFSGTVSCLQFNLFILIAGSHDKSLRTWNFDRNYREDVENNTNHYTIIEPLMVVRHHKAPIVALKYDGLKNIISADSIGSIFITDLSGALLNVLLHDKLVEPITSLRLVGALAIASTSNGKVMFWNRFNNQCEAAVKCHNSSVNSIDYFDGRFYTAGADGYVKEWDLSTLTCLRELKSHESSVLDVKANDIRIISCSNDGLIKIWEMTTPINKLPKDALI